MTDVLVLGGTGHLGRDIVRQLRSNGRTVRVLARQHGNEPGVEWAKGDLATGAGVSDALRGVETVIHAATFSPIARRGSIRPTDLFTSPPDVDVDGTRRLLQECERAGTKRLLYVSIVGVDLATLPYAKVKAAGEKLVLESPLAWSAVRATGFYYLLERMLAGFHWLPIWPVPDAPINPVDTSDVAAYLAECLDDWKNGVREEIGGPETLSFVEFARQYQSASGMRRPVLPIRLSAQTALKFGFAEAHGRRGSKTWSAWLGEHRARRAA